MKKTFITSLPDHAGAFLEAGRIIAAAGANITRVSYNKAVDTHMLFIDASGTQEQLETVTERLKQIGYIQNRAGGAQVMLIDFLLPDVPGSLLPALELIGRYAFNISYINSREDGSGFQSFRVGLFIENPHDIKAFLGEAAGLCEVRVVEYDQSERVLDNTVFYMSFANTVAKKLKLRRSQSRELMAQSNRIMQMLDARQEPPYKTFDYIGRFADMLVRYKGEAFRPRISRMALKDGFDLTCIEPPCGSNTYILRKDDALLFVDSGFAIYAPEMYKVILDIHPDFERLPRQIIITHPDEDHCGLLNLFDEVYVSPIAWEHFRLENAGQPNFREQHPVHEPYIRISGIMSGYFPPRMDCLKVVNGGADDPSQPICYLGSVTFKGKKFDLYRGNGGHAKGEVVIVDEAEKLIFSGDIEVNIHGYTPPQAEFNRLAPYLMTSVNMDSAQFRVERRALLEKFRPGEYTYCCGHGAIIRAGEEAGIV